MLNKILIPLSIVLAGGLIAVSLYYSKNNPPSNLQNGEQEESTQTINEVSLNSITEEDNIQGNPNAEIFIVEYSDLQCTFCQRFHDTVKSIMAEYGPEGKVAWVYRHYPIDAIHPLARGASEATECVSNIAGNNVFWAYLDALFAKSPESLTPENLLAEAKQLGVDENAFTSCVQNRETKDRVDRDYQDGNKIAQFDRKFGTPYTIIMDKNGNNRFPIAGAVPYNVVKQAIDTMLLNRE